MKIRYIDRTRDYYRAQGFKADYAWSTNDETPFTPLTKLLSECTVTFVTTAVVESDIPKPIRTAQHYDFASAPAQFFTEELSWDKVTTHTRDRSSYFPIEVLRSLEEEGVIGNIASRFHFVPTEYSQRLTIDQDAPAIADACTEDEVDIAILIPL